jgi:CRISPR-associated Csx14 family protein
MSTNVINVLIAALGDHPAVITAAMTAMEKVAGIPIHHLHVLHPQDTGKYIGREGFNLITRHLQERCQVFPVPLPFADANSTAASIQFLQILAAILERYHDEQMHHIYLLLAGGRKNMAALMALVSQFFPAVRGIYHILDRDEDSRNPAFPSIEQIELEMNEAQVRAALDPPLERLNLISIPYPGAFASSVELRRRLKSLDAGKELESVELTLDAEYFFQKVFQPLSNTHRLDVWLSQRAYEQYQAWFVSGNNHAKEFLTCFEHMRDPFVLKEREKGTFGEYRFFKRRRTTERPLFYTEPNSIDLYPERSVEQVIVCALSVEQGNGQYEPTANEILANLDRVPSVRLSDLNRRDLTLIVPLGKSPMIATQTYTLLTQSVTEGRPRIPTVALVYPERNPVIANGARLLKRQFERRGVSIEDQPIRCLRDLDSREACEIYLRELLGAIRTLQDKHPDRQIALSLSGGRKGMSALTYFAAQYAGVERVYHTLISDLNLERRMETEMTLREIEGLPTDEAKARRLFLDEYERTKFELISIPIIPFTPNM